MKKYIRCRFCDSAFYVDDIENGRIVFLGNKEKIKHRRAEFACPACNSFNEEVFIFNQETK